MKNVKLMESIVRKQLDCSERLYAFWSCYEKRTADLCEKYLSHPIESRESYMVGELCRWLEKEGYLLILGTVEQLNNGASDKLDSFIELYTFLLSCASEDTITLIDQLFSIPGQFAREFMREEKMLIGEYASEADDCERGIEYKFNNKGTFAKVPYFLGD